MQKDLEVLWFDYLIEFPIARSKKEKTTIDKWSKKEKYFRSKLNEEQIIILDEYDDAVSAVSRISEKNAFLKGFMFATRFIFQALYGE